MNFNCLNISVVIMEFQKVTFLCANGEFLLCKISSFAIWKLM
ncbi:hypothetical protein HMPREF3226_02371 [Prevotella corporis]|uniref:Uncharacterized protein n=1 Tax=Prevotella corporis TaxID=28128 RepID=A0A133PW86_9BACT|nr:hypothetical protein HMPREF3226_02371 [Prevotella corporis]